VVPEINKGHDGRLFAIEKADRKLRHAFRWCRGDAESWFEAAVVSFFDRYSAEEGMPESTPPVIFHRVP